MWALSIANSTESRQTSVIFPAATTILTCTFPYWVDSDVPVKDPDTVAAAACGGDAAEVAARFGEFGRTSVPTCQGAASTRADPSIPTTVARTLTSRRNSPTEMTEKSHCEMTSRSPIRARRRQIAG